ncbi:FAD-dependent oxidoreductase [Streptomyces afghaniensis]|uniref:FAD-dependent oxidoreductase n=1 Tax=Streptomyces afghaniensis TaxID=66865 RepID=UPI002787D85B|nr:FAD-dependent oxidoreductase [Streptomyces afghaniensis]MDQ1014628.1 nitrite reductase (NADH) large subunit [Streptomyces afghaniensis]
MTRTPRTLVVVGHGMTGHRLVEHLRTHDRHGTWRVVVLAEEPRPAYNRVALSSYLEGRSAADLTLAGHAFLTDPLVELRTAAPVTGIDRQARAVTTADGAVTRYDALVLATGSRPFVPPVPGHDLPGCFVYRTFDDLDAIREAAREGGPGVVVGGGLLGLEAANALRLLGVRPHVVELAPRLMPVQLDDGGARVLTRLVTGLGLRVHCGTAVRAVHPAADGRVGGIALTDGAELDARMVVFSAGVRPRDELAGPAGLATGDRGGFLVDDLCRTADPGVWAVGECAAVRGRTHGLAAPGYRMAELVADQLLGRTVTPFTDPDTATKLKLLGVDVASFGDAHAETDGALEYVLRDDRAGTYAKLVLDPEGRILRGGVLAGDASAYRTLRALTGRELTASPDRLLSVPGPAAPDPRGGRGLT